MSKPDYELRARMMTRSAYDLQKLRQQVGKRIDANFRSRFGQENGKTENINVIKEVKDEYKRITDGVANVTRMRKLPEGSIIESKAELLMIRHYMKLLNEEGRLFRHLESVLDPVPIYNEFLADIRGMGPALCGVIVGEIDIEKAPYPSSLWRYAGLDVVDGEGRTLKHRREIEVDDGEGGTKKAKTAGYNVWLKSKLVGEQGVADQFVMQGTQPYRDIYVRRKEQELEKEAVETKGHAHNRALRYVAKEFLKDLYNEWREVAGLPVAPTYAERDSEPHKHREDYEVARD